MKNKKTTISFLFLFIIIPLFCQIPKKHETLINDLNKKLINKGIPFNWLNSNIENKKFEIYYKIPKYFYIMPENRVTRKEKTFDWYLKVFDIPSRIKSGKKFIEKNIDLLETIESKNGIYYELIVAIIGLETNYALNDSKGNFYTFSALVTQYILMPKRRDFALRQLYYLYLFSIKTNRPTYYFIGSFAGACGWSQFIPSSLYDFFVDYNENDNDIDIYSVEDCLSSIENYLFKHYLNKNNISDYKSRYSAVFSYNPSDAYTKTILYMYEEFKKLRPE